MSRLAFVLDKELTSGCAMLAIATEDRVRVVLGWEAFALSPQAFVDWLNGVIGGLPSPPDGGRRLRAVA